MLIVTERVEVDYATSALVLVIWGLLDMSFALCAIEESILIHITKDKYRIIDVHHKGENIAK